MLIRPAREDDLPDIVRMAQAFVEGTSYQQVLTVQPVLVGKLAQTLIQNPDALALIAEDEDGARVGMLGMITIPHPLSGERLAMEVVWWVDEHARGGGVKLMKAAEAWARAQGCAAIQMIAPSPRVAKLYEFLQYRQVEVAYQKRLT